MQQTPNRKGLFVTGTSDHVMACIISLSTGYAGESWCDQFILYPGDIDSTAKEMAYDHASSYGSESSCQCSVCGDDDGDDRQPCKEEDCNGVYVYEENDNVNGSIYKIQPSRSLDYVNGGSNWGEIFLAAIANNIMSISDDGKKVLIYKTAMEAFLYLPNQEEWDCLFSELVMYYNLNEVEFA